MFFDLASRYRFNDGSRHGVKRILLGEQFLRLAHRGYVLVAGQVTLSGTGAELHDNPEIQAAYLEGAA